MKIIDLSVAVNEDTPAYPGDPKIKIKKIGTYEQDTYNDHHVSFGIHSSGTHIDAPFHMVADGKSLHQIHISQFVGRGRLVSVDGKFDIKAVKKAKIEKDDVVLFHTGMAEFYGQDDKYYGDDRPEITEEIANYLVQQKIKMAGLDMCSPDKEPFSIHRILLENEILIIENMTNLDKLEGKEFTVYALPINLQLDGGPARVIAQIN